MLASFCRLTLSDFRQNIYLRIFGEFLNVVALSAFCKAHCRVMLFNQDLIRLAFLLCCRHGRNQLLIDSL